MTLDCTGTPNDRNHISLPGLPVLSLLDFIKHVPASVMVSPTDATTQDIVEAYHAYFKALIEENRSLPINKTVFRPNARWQKEQFREAQHKR